MADPKGDKLVVNVAASEARRRLKGFGHGVRKIRSAGRNQALIIHTATGRHLAELEGKFADVGFSGRQRDLGEPIDNLRNLSRSSAERLRLAGIRTLADLQRDGPAAAYARVKQQQPEVRLNLLWELAAGLAGKDWRELTDSERRELLSQLDQD